MNDPGLFQLTPILPDSPKFSLTLRRSSPEPLLVKGVKGVLLRLRTPVRRSVNTLPLLSPTNVDS